MLIVKDFSAAHALSVGRCMGSCGRGGGPKGYSIPHSVYKLGAAPCWVPKRTHPTGEVRSE